MERLTIFALCWLAAFTIAVPRIAAQTNGSVAQNNSAGATVNGHSHANNGHPNAAVSHGIARGPVSFAPGTINSHSARIAGQPGINPGTTYSPFLRPMNPTLAAMSARQSERTYNLHPNIDVLARREIAQSSRSMASAQRVARAENLQPGSDDSVRRDMAETRLNTIVTPRVQVSQPTSLPDLANRGMTQETARWNWRDGNNRLSYFHALRRHRHEWHNRDWWQQHCNTIVFNNGGYYFLDAGYWYPALGYDPNYNYYDQDGPIYTYGNLLPDQVIANVQEALQEAGYYGGPITGSFDVETRAALANFQRDYGLLITGAIDQPTIESLGLY
jgi:putative peptidoglycan binding protein